MTKYFVFVVFTILCFESCSQKRTKECAEFSRKGFDELHHYLNGDKKRERLEISSQLFDKAIDCDSSNLINYQNKITVVNLLGRYDESLVALDKLFKLSGSSDAQILVSMALIYEKLEVIDSTANILTRALELCDSQLALKPNDSTKVICNKSYVIAAMSGRDSALSILRPFLAKHPNDSTLYLFEVFIKNFDKQSVLDGFSNVIQPTRPRQ